MNQIGLYGDSAGGALTAATVLKMRDEGIGLPAIVLYKVGEVYFVVDGHHRVSVARKQGQVFIDADVREFNTGVKITSNMKMKDLELLCANLIC